MKSLLILLALSLPLRSHAAPLQCDLRADFALHLAVLRDAGSTRTEAIMGLLENDALDRMSVVLVNQVFDLPKLTPFDHFTLARKFCLQVQAGK